MRIASAKCLRHSGTYRSLPPISTWCPSRSTAPVGDTRTTIVAFRPQQQIVFSSDSVSAQASRAALPGNSSPRKSVRSP